MNQEIEDLKKLVNDLSARVEQLEKRAGGSDAPGIYNDLTDDEEDEEVSPETRAKLEALMKELGM
jgi:hypothetical protein